MRALENFHTKLNALVVCAILAIIIIAAILTTPSNLNLYTWLTMITITSITYQLHYEIYTDMRIPNLPAALYAKIIIKTGKKANGLQHSEIDKQLCAYQNKHIKSVKATITLFFIFTIASGSYLFTNLPKNLLFETIFTVLIALVAVGSTKFICDKARKKNIVNLQQEIEQQKLKHSQLFNN
ncbi:MAG: hypothetical protein ACI9TY_001550 [Alphaproteobacteria bacterium]|jgi:hypothetical protein